MSNQPTIFIASSVEGLPIAEAVNIKLEYEARVQQWDNAFDLSSTTINALIKQAKESDYAIFIFHQDDKTIIRNNLYSVVRDNVLFELGLFIGTLGLERCFILTPRSSAGEFRLPTDLAGVTLTSYDDTLDDKVQAVAASCGKIKIQISKHQKHSNTNLHSENKGEYNSLAGQMDQLESQLWMHTMDLQRANEEKGALLEAIKNSFFDIAKPATEAEILAWEVGAKVSYLKEIKITRHKVYHVDRDVIIPPGFGAGAISVIVAQGVKVYHVDRGSHNSIYYMDGFRQQGL